MMGYIKTKLRAVIGNESSEERPSILWPLHPEEPSSIMLMMEDGRTLVVRVEPGDDGWGVLRMWVE